MKTALRSPFSKETYNFLMDLEDNNNRPWFDAHKDEYETAVREPALEFIRQIGAGLKKVSPHFRAEDKKIGGSLMRVHRDVRFSRNKQPYKTNVGIHFRHEVGKDVHAPGFYVHIHADESFLGVGLWRPDPPALAAIRELIDGEPAAWKKARDDKKFQARFKLAGDVLKRPPRGFDADHPDVEDLKRKDFIAAIALRREDVLEKTFVADVLSDFMAAKPFMRFLCRAVNLPF